MIKARVVGFAWHENSTAQGLRCILAPELGIYQNVRADKGHGGYADFYAALKHISDKSANGIGFLAVFSHGGVEY